MPVSTCPSCGASGDGRYCSQCGTSLGGAAPSRQRRAWIAASGLLLVSVLVVLWALARRPAAVTPAAPARASAPAAAPPDLSRMTPRERFDRLYRRVLGAAETGDTATAARFAPMAFTAYGQLDSADADARYQAAVLHLHVQGDTASALRLADTVLAANSHHLLGHLIRAMAARLVGDQLLLERAEAGLLKSWDAEMKAARPEYAAHRGMLEQFHAAASAAPAGPKRPTG